MSNLDDFFSAGFLNEVVDGLIDGHFDVIADRPRISTGADRIDLNLFQRDQEKHLSAIQRKVLEGRYTFTSFLERQIPKADSKDMRTISVASIRDAVVQRALYEYLYPIVDAKLSDAVFGYRKGRSAHDAIALIRRHFDAGLWFVFDADLEKFFDSVDHDVLLDMVTDLAIDDRARTLIRRFLKTGRIPSEQVEEHRASKGKQHKFAPVRRTKGVPQGGVLSGMLANLYLAAFDTAVLSRFPGLVRYADDFLVCCASSDECRDVHELVNGQLAPLRVNLHPTKTKECVSAASGVDFLGFRISTRGVRVRGRNIARFKARIRNVLATQKVHPSPERTLRSLCWRLQFKIRGPDESQLEKLAERGKPISLCRRSWIGFFRVVDDLTQIRALDRWIRSEVSEFMWRNHRCRVRLEHMQDYGLPSLINSLWKARRTTPVRTDDEP